MRALINAFIIHLTLNILVFLKGWNAFEGKKTARIIMAVIFGLELLIYSIGFIFYRHLPEAVTQFIRVMGTCCTTGCINRYLPCTMMAVTTTIGIR